MKLRRKDLSEFWKRYKKNRAAVLGLGLLLFIIFIAITGPIISPYPPLKTLITERLEPPNKKHLMGGDALGRDILSGVIYGSRSSLIVGCTSTLIATLIGIIIGSVAGYHGGKFDSFLMRITDAIIILPTFIVIMVLVALFGSSIFMIITIMASLRWTRTARLVRAEFLTLKEREFVVAARAMGAGDINMMFGEILPNSLSPVIVNSSMGVGGMILWEAALSFLGLGDPNVVSWGKMLYNAQPYIRYAWWPAFFPGLAIFITVLSLNLIGDGLNDALNPRLKERGVRVG